jgi:hypothetical protein
LLYIQKFNIIIAVYYKKLSHKGETMRRLSRVLVLALVFVMLIPTAAFSAQGKTEGVYAYEINFEGYSEEDIANIKPDFTVSNVVKVLNKNDYPGNLDAVFIAEAPAEITVQAEFGVCLFTVYPVTKNAGGTDYIFTYGTEMPITGPVEIWQDEMQDWKTIDISELGDYGYEVTHQLTGEFNYFYRPGSKVTLTEPGEYYAYLVREAVGDVAEALIIVQGPSEENSSEPTKDQPALPKTVQAAPTSSKVMVNGKAVEFEAYNINGNNYFKLRDLALAVNGTDKQFGVEWDGQKNAINLASNTPYIVVGGELSKGDGNAKEGILSTSAIYKDGNEISLTAYNINGNNYFKLRDLAKEFDIGVAWDGANNAVIIDTSKGYEEAQ